MHSFISPFIHSFIHSFIHPMQVQWQGILSTARQESEVQRQQILKRLVAKLIFPGKGDLKIKKVPERNANTVLW